MPSARKSSANKKKSAKNPAAQSLGRKGGRARMNGMTAKERSELARKAAKKRWGK